MANSFKTIEEYENYLNMLYEFIQNKMEKAQEELQYMDVNEYIQCHCCYHKSPVVSFKFAQTSMKEKAYRDCLAMFSLVERKMKK